MIEPSVIGVLRSRYTIRRFYGLCVFALILIAAILVSLAEVFGAGWFRETIISVLAHLAGAVIVLMLVYGAWLWVTPPELRNARVSALRAGEIPEAMAALVSGATDYWFMGRSGGYFRAKVLPDLDDEARQSRRAARVRVVVPEPLRGRNALAYSSMLQGLGEQVDRNTLPAAVVATVLDAAKRAVENTYLEVEIGMTPTLPVVRFDVSNNGAVITSDAKSLPGIFCGPASPYREMFRSIIDNELRQSTRITWDPDLDVAGISNAADLARSFRGLPTVDDDVLARAKDMIKHPRHRYGPGPPPSRNPHDGECRRGRSSQFHGCRARGARSSGALDNASPRLLPSRAGHRCGRSPAGPCLAPRVGSSRRTGRR
jgi:hypothetical protein